MSSLSTSDARQIFESLDQNNDGILSLDELIWLLEKTGVHTNEDELNELVGKDGLNFDDFSCFYDSILNNDHDNSVGCEVTQNVNDENEKEEEDKDLRKAFKVFDLNGDGLISPQELQSVLWNLGMWGKYGALDCDRIIRKYDVNSDGLVDFNEFKTMMLAH